MKTFLLAVLVWLAQVPSQPATQSQMGSIEGVVLEVSGKPIAGARVRAFWSPPPMAYSPEDLPQALTDSNGRFRIENLNAGGYEISVTASGYIEQTLGALPGRGNSGAVTALEPGQSLQGIILGMTPGNVIAGRITTTNGQPLVRMQVVAARKTFDAFGSSYLLAQGWAETNDRGEYRIAGLAPGRYYIRAASISAALIDNEVRRTTYETSRPAPILPTPGLFAPAYYPGQADPAKAAVIEVQERAEVLNIDFALSKQQTFRIWGRVTDPYTGGPPQEKFSILMFPVQVSYPTSINGTSIANNPTGYFEVTDVIPGVYMVTAQMQTRVLTPVEQALRMTPGVSRSQLPPPPARGVALVQVAGADVENIAITIARDLAVTGRVSVEDGTVQLGGVEVELLPVNSNGQTSRAFGSAMVSAEGEFTVKNIIPYFYRVTVSNLPAGFYVKEAQLANVNLLTLPLALTRPPDGSMRIVLAKGGALAGTVIDTPQRPVPNQQVVLIPDASRDRGDLYKTATTDANGRFSIQGIAPGEYKAYAWQTIEQFGYFDVEFVRRFEDKATPIRITEASEATVNLTLIR
jgi:hypothetical protein